MPRLHERRWKSGDRRLWRGTLESIPKGWVIDDDTKDRAVVGAGGEHQNGATFGEDSQQTDTHTLSESQMPAHRHSMSVYSTSNIDTRVSSYGTSSYRGKYNTDSKGGSLPHDHGRVDVRQKSIALYVLRKL